MERGDILGDRYRLVAPLGHGGTAVVWQARDEVLGRDVAVKLPAARLDHDAALVSRLRGEARAAARLRHPHVVAVHDFGEVPQPDRPALPYVVLEFVAGKSLADVLRGGPLPWPDAVTVCAQVAAALAAAHDRGVVHRDVKPGNVMLTGDGARLVDFGISATTGESDIGPDGELLGTPAYLAPERLTTGRVHPACDVYGLGLLLYKTLTGELPWPRSELTELLTAGRQVAPAPLPQLPGLPGEVADLYRRCLAKQPADRPSSAQAASVLAEVAGTAVPTALMAGAAAAAISDSVGASELMTATQSAAVGREPAWTAAMLPGMGRTPRAGKRRVLALAAAAVILVGGLMGSRVVVDDRPPAGPGASAQPVVACEVWYDVRADSGSGFTAEVTLTNTGAEALAQWRLEFMFPADQQVTSASAGFWRQSGRSVAVAGSDVSSTLPAGQSVNLDFEGSYRDANPLPTTFYVNGTGCTPVLTAAVGVANSDVAEESTEAVPSSGAGAGLPAEGEPGDAQNVRGGDGDGRAGNGNGNPGNRNGNGNVHRYGNGHGAGPGRP